MESLFIKHCKTTKFLLFQKVYQVKLADLHYLCLLFQTLNYHDERILSTDAALCSTVHKVLGMVNTAERIVRCFQYFFFLTIDSDIKYLVQDRREQKCISADGMGKC